MLKKTSSWFLLVVTAVLMTACSTSATPTGPTPTAPARNELSCRTGYHVATRADGTSECVADELVQPASTTKKL